MSNLRSSLLALAVLLAVSPANASTISLQTTPAAAAALPQFAGGSVVTFDSARSGSYTSYTEANITFTADNLMYIDSEWMGAFNNFGTNSLHNVYADTSFGQLTFTLTSPVNALGFFWGASNNLWTLNGYNSSNELLESFSLPITEGSNSGDFVGIAATGIAYATLTGPSSDYIFVDNVMTSAVPVPAALPLFGTALAGLGVFGRRKKTA
jgi:hypothetical protein